MTNTENTKMGATVSIMWMSLLLFSVLVGSAFGYSGENDGSTDYYRGHEQNGDVGTNRQLPVILMHKQALQQDGGFQYAFAADNGLRQGESIRPDGSRTGTYSYTDPTGKEISVKYTAGKDGFRIIQGDHVPKAPLSVVPLQQQPAYVLQSSPVHSGSPLNRLFSVPGGPGSQFSVGNFNNVDRFGSNSGEAFNSPLPYKLKYLKPQQHYRVHEENSAELAGKYEDDGSSSYDGAGDYSSHSPFRAPSSLAHVAYSGVNDNYQKDDDSYNSNERQQPHSFGSGYAFEFVGTANDGI